MQAIKPCPECGRKPKWTTWTPIESDYDLILWALRCKQKDHQCHGSYRAKRSDAVSDWNIEVDRMNCKLPDGRGWKNGF